MTLWAALLIIASTEQVENLTIQSDVDCPGAPAVAARMLPLVPPLAPPARLLISNGSQPGTLSLRLEHGPNLLGGGRQLPQDPDCNALTDEIAVIAATWLTLLPPPASDSLDLPAGRAPPPMPSGSPTAVVASAPAPPRLTANRRFALGLASGWLFATAGGGAPVGMVEGAWTPRRWERLLVGVGVQATGQWERPLAEGQVAWRRGDLTLRAGWRFVWRRFSVIAEGGIQTGLVWIRGVAFTTTQTATQPTVGPFCGVRLNLALGGGALAPRLWVGARVGADLLRYVARVNNLDARLPLASGQGGPMLGLEFPLPG